MTRFNDALKRFRARLTQTAGHNVVVTRKDSAIAEIVAVPEVSKIDYLTDKGVRASAIVYDFCVSADSDWIPERGDRVLWNGASYIVRPVGAEWWRYDDAEKTFIRVHTQIEAQ